MQTKNHWETVYATKPTTELSWYQKQAALSLRLIQNAAQTRADPIIDVGSGASTLIDGLIDQGYNNLSALDISGSAQAAAQARLGPRAQALTWIQANVLQATLPPSHYAIWHDRAVFHFLTTPEERKAYVQQIHSALKPGGTAIIATFAENGPTKCSGLPVIRYSAEQLHAELGPLFALIQQEREEHPTPGGNTQKFIYCVFQKIDGKAKNDREPTASNC